MADADAAAAEIALDMRLDGTQTVIAGMTAAGFQAEFSGRQIQLVMEDDNPVGRNVVITRGFAHGAATFIVIGAGFQQQDFFGTGRRLDRALAHRTLEARLPGAQTPIIGNLIECEKADIVAVIAIFRVRIAQTDDQQHGQPPNGGEARPLVFGAFALCVIGFGLGAFFAVCIFVGNSRFVFQSNAGTGQRGDGEVTV